MIKIRKTKSNVVCLIALFENCKVLQDCLFVDAHGQNLLQNSKQFSSSLCMFFSSLP